MERTGEWSELHRDPPRTSADSIMVAGRAVGTNSSSSKRLTKTGSSSHPHRMRRLQVLLAEATHADRQLKSSLHALSRTVTTAKHEGLVHSFFDEGPAILGLLRGIRRRRMAQESGDDPSLLSDIDLWIRGLVTDGPRDIETMGPAVFEQPNCPLTRKEVQILELLACGHSNKQMAERLFVSESTVRTHLRSINHKLRARNRTQAIAIARMRGFVA